MKVSQTPPPIVFQPVTLTLETPNEVALFRAFVGAIAPANAEAHFGVPPKGAIRCWSHVVYDKLTETLGGHKVPQPMLTINWPTC